MRVECRPSNLYRREACPGSGRMEMGLPDTTSEYAERGTKLHEVMVKMSRNPGWTNLDELSTEDRWAVEYCWGEVYQLFVGNAHCEFLHEVKLDIIGGMTGTADLVLLEKGDAAILVDYKFGHGYVPHPKRNVQFMAYAVALAKQYDLKAIHAIKLQPYSGDPREEYTYDVIDLEEAEDRIAGIIDGANADTAELKAGEHCKYCKAREVCPARMKIAESLPTSRTLSELFGTLLPMERREFVEKLIVARDWADDAYKAFETFVLEGGEVPGWGIGKGRTSRKWKDEASALAYLGEKKPGANLVGLLSPAQVEKIVGKGAVPEELLEVSEGKPTVKRVKA